MPWSVSKSEGLAQHAPPANRSIKGRSGATESFFRTDSSCPQPVLVVHHIQKTAGTSLRRVIRANLPPAQVDVVPHLRLVARTPAELLAWYRDWYESLDDDRRDRLSCVMSHWAGFLLPALDRPAEALTLVREPVDRTLSYYFFKQRRRGPDRPLPPLEQLYELGAAGGLGRTRNELWDQLCNWQSRALLSIFHDTSTLEHTAGPSVDADLWRGRLRDLVDSVFIVGVQDRFEEYVEALSRRYGWQAFVPRSKVNPHRPAPEPSAEPRELILAYNWLDSELYDLCREAQARREAEQRS
jgi:Sulfotransferase family